MWRGNTSTLNSQGGGNRAHLLRRPRSTLPHANVALGRRLRGTDRRDLFLSTVVDVGPASEHLGLFPTFPLLQAQLSSASDLVPPRGAQKGQYRPARQICPPEGAHPWDLDETLVGQSVETPHSSFQHSPLANGEEAVSVSNTVQRDDVDLGSQIPKCACPSVVHVPHFEIPHIQPTSLIQAQQAAPALPPIGNWATGTSNSSSFRKNGNGLQVVLFGEMDPDKLWKRRDNSEDKQRKEEILKKHGTCLRCKKAKKQCNGGEVCDYCHKRSFDCIRTCKLCWSNKLGCDERDPCKNCRRAGKTCVRPPTSNARTKDTHQFDLNGVASPALRNISSSAQVNKHTILETGRQILAPTAWNLTFAVAPAPQNNDVVHVMSATSESGLLWRQPYSQQSTKVDFHHTFTNGSIKVASEENSLQVPGKQHIASELCSVTTDGTIYFEEAMHFSDHGSLSLKALDVHAWDYK